MAASFVIRIDDAIGEGFNDPAPFTSIGGNTATTLGEARLNVFREAARIWGGLIAENLTVTVIAGFEPMDCGNTTGTLGGAGPESFYLRNGYWYPGPLFGALTGRSALATITASFNSRVGTSGCLGGRPFYYGFDHEPGAGHAADLLEVLLHEFAHGLGFISALGGDGAGIADRNGTEYLSIFDKFVYDETQGLYWNQMASNAQRSASARNDGHLVWNGANVNNQLGVLVTGKTGEGHVRLHAPAVWDEASSIAHWDLSASPNLLMEPYATGSTRGYTDLTTCVLYDIGWTGSYCPDVADRPAGPVTGGTSSSNAGNNTSPAGNPGKGGGGAFGILALLALGLLALAAISAARGSPRSAARSSPRSAPR
jgi:hypothetical protein